MLQESVYAVPSQLVIKQWTHAREADRSRRLLLRNASSTDSAMIVLVTPRTKRFRFAADAPLAVDDSDATASQGSHAVPGGEERRTAASATFFRRRAL